MTGDGSWAYGYDYEGRMVSTEKAGTQVNYTYDDFGRRIKKNVNSLITNYLYDGSQCILEKDNGGMTQARYVYGSRIDEPIIMIRDGNTYYYHFDGLGNVVDITDRNGVTVESYTYDAFGKVSIENPHVNPPIPNPNPHIPPRNPRIPSPPQSTGNPYFFTGRRLDTETGLYYYRARYYDPGMGRFLTTDPVGYREGMNLYTYCKNNPVKYVDPYGLGASGGGGDDDELDIKKAIDDIAKTKWAKTWEGRKILKALKRAHKEGKIKIHDLSGIDATGFYNDKLGVILIDPTVSQAKAPLVLVHEGTHMVQHTEKGRNFLYTSSAAKEAEYNESIVEKQLYGE